MKRKKSINNAFCLRCGSVKRDSYRLTPADVNIMEKYNLAFMLHGKKIYDSEGNYKRYKYREL